VCSSGGRQGAPARAQLVFERGKASASSGGTQRNPAGEATALSDQGKYELAEEMDEQELGLGRVALGNYRPSIVQSNIECMDGQVDSSRRHAYPVRNIVRDNGRPASLEEKQAWLMEAKG
jgi:hypothetical protein